jgi:hypothetical protein
MQVGREVVGLTYEDGYALCVECANHDDEGASGVVFRWDESDGMTCDQCHERIHPSSTHE